MESFAEELKELVISLLEPLIDNPEALVVTSNTDDGRVYIEIECAPDDTGKVIGRQGRVIKSIRTIARAAGSRRDADVDVELVE